MVRDRGGRSAGPVARVLSEASVRIQADSRAGERDARRAGERYGRAFARGADDAVADALTDAVSKVAAPQVGLDVDTAELTREVDDAVTAAARAADPPAINVPTTADAPDVPRGNPDPIRIDTIVDPPVVPPPNDVPTVDVPVDADMDDFERTVRTETARVTRNVRASVKVDVDVDQAAVARLTRSLSAGVSVSRIAASVFGAVSSAVSTISGAMDTAIGKVDSFADSVGKSMASAGGSIAKVAAIAVALAPVFGLLAGAVIAATGAIGAGIAGLPALLTAFGAPIAAIVVGFDGIKAAAQQLKPHIDDLKASVSATFERTMLPVFDKLHAVFPVLETGLNGIAEGVARFADGLVDVVTSSEGLDNIRDALQNVQLFLDTMLPGVQKLTEAFLEVASTEGLFRVLGDTIGNLAEDFGGFLERVTESGLLVDTLGALRDVLRSAGGAMGALTEGAMEFFQQAAPGFSDFFEGLQAAFENIDFAALGESFGQIFKAIGDGLEKVPPETWGMLAEAVQFFADAVTRFVESGGLNLLIVGFAGLVLTAGLLLDALTLLAAPFSFLAENMNFLAASVTILQTIWGIAWDSIVLKVQQAGVLIPAIIGAFGAFIAQKFDEIRAAVAGKMAEIILNVIGKFQEMKDRAVAKFEELKGQARAKFDEIKGAIERAIEGAKQAVQRKAQELKDAAVRKFDELVAFVRGIPGKIQSALTFDLSGSGRALIAGFQRGIESAGEAVVGAAKSIAARVRAIFPFSPAKEGPFSGRGWVLYSGIAVGEAFAEGMDRARSTARDAAARLAAAAQDAMPISSTQWVQAGRSLVDDLIDGVLAATPALEAAVRRATDGLGVVDTGVVVRGAGGGVGGAGRGAAVPTAGSGGGPEATLRQLAALLNAAELRISGGDLALVVNDANRSNARR